MRADYLARLVESGVDVVYVLSGQRAEGQTLGAGPSRLLSAYLALPADVQQAMLTLAEAVRDQAEAGSRTVHAKRIDYRAEERP